MTFSIIKKKICAKRMVDKSKMLRKERNNNRSAASKMLLYIENSGCGFSVAGIAAFFIKSVALGFGDAAAKKTLPG